MNALVFAQTDSTGQKVTLIVFGLVAVAAALALLTAWYWRTTDPALRDGGARGRRGRPTPDRPEPGPSTGTGAGPSTHPVRTDRSDESTDQTRLLNRSDILEPDQTPDRPLQKPRPDVIDLRDPSSDVGSAGSASADDPTGEIAEPGTEGSGRPDRRGLFDDAVLDLDSVDKESVEAVPDGPAGAHDEGIDFDEWLALAEEDS